MSTFLEIVYNLCYNFIFIKHIAQGYTASHTLYGEKKMDKLLAEVDREIVEIVSNDLSRQQDSLMLIPSENYASRAVMEIQGSILANK